MPDPTDCIRGGGRLFAATAAGRLAASRSAVGPRSGHPPGFQLSDKAYAPTSCAMICASLRGAAGGSVTARLDLAGSPTTDHAIERPWIRCSSPDAPVAPKAYPSLSTLISRPFNVGVVFSKVRNRRL